MIVEEDVVEEDLVPPTERERHRVSPVLEGERLTGRGIHIGKQCHEGLREIAMFRT